MNGGKLYKPHSKQHSKYDMGVSAHEVKVAGANGNSTQLVVHPRKITSKTRYTLHGMTAVHPTQLCIQSCQPREAGVIECNRGMQSSAHTDALILLRKQDLTG